MSLCLCSLLVQLAYLPDRKRESITDDAGSIDSEISNDGRSDTANIDDLVRDYRKNRRRGMLDWFKVKVNYCSIFQNVVDAKILKCIINALHCDCRSPRMCLGHR